MRPRLSLDVSSRSTPSGLDLYVIIFLGVSFSESAASHGRESPLKKSLLDREGYEITYPHWIHPGRLGTSSLTKERPAEAEVLVTAGGLDLRLHLQRNEQLLAPGFQEIWYTPSGARLTSSPPSTGHCLYHGWVQGVEGSSVALSTCSGLRGLITLNTSLNYLIEPLPMSNDTHPHAVFPAKSLHPPSGSCQHHPSNQERREGLDDLIHGMMVSQAGRRREQRDVSQNMKYVELLLVADHAEFQKHNQSIERTKLKLLEAANYVDKYYKALSIRVALIGLEVWSDQDRISVSDNPYSTLAAFLAWRRKQLHTLPNDNAQLITGVAFRGTTIGLAPLKAMCSEYQSGGVNSDHSDSAVGVAATMAHEMGHNFGMSHDSYECCQARSDEGGCIMAAATGHPFPRVFNLCNQKELHSYMGSGGGKCLFNLPNTRAMYGGQRCGNGYLEDGEECDCGEEEECTSPCCNANNCTLRAGAECAHGVCCHDCKLKNPGALCRPPSGSCDLPEYCDGKSESCPANFYLVDGTSCSWGQAFCYTGMCLTLEQQCQSLWGRDARPAPDLCFERVNEAGDSYGNCGKDLLGKYRSCKDRNAKCGKIQCLSSAPKPIDTHAVPIDTTVTAGHRKVLCRGTHVYRAGGAEDEGQGDTLDPGLVLTGTKCGEDGICFGGECRNASFLRADECSAKCHGHGLCNNNHNCHCDSGWAPPLCDQEGSGGSVDSGPVLTQSSLLPVLLLLLLAGFVLLVVVGLWCYYRQKLRPLKPSSSLPAPVCPGPTEVKVTHANSHVNSQANGQANGHTNPTFLLKCSDKLSQSSPRPSPSCPTRSRNSIVRPTVKPPPIPSYAGLQKDKPPQPLPQLQPLPQPQPPPKPTHAATHSKALPKPQPPPLPSVPPPLPTLPHSPPTPSPSELTTPRPEPPNRPPPPLPHSKPAQEKQHSRVQVSIDALQKRKTTLVPPSGHGSHNRPKNMTSGKS